MKVLKDVGPQLEHLLNVAVKTVRGKQQTLGDPKKYDLVLCAIFNNR